MKKHYIQITVIITSLILIAFILAGGFFTYMKSQEVIDDRMAYIQTADNRLEYSDEADESGAIDRIYSHSGFVAQFGEEDVGIYDHVTIGGKVITSSDYLIVDIAWEEDGKTVYDDRIVRIDEPLDLDVHYLYNCKIDAKCDDKFIFDGSIFYTEDGWQTSSEIKIPDNPAADHENFVSAEEWIHDSDMQIELVPLAKTAGRRKLNREAEEIYNDFMEGLTQGDFANKKTSIFTTYAISMKSNSFTAKTRAGGVCVYVFHPVKIVLSKYLSTYILGVIALLLIEGAVIYMMRKLYGNRLSYDLQRQSMTRSLAHDLKTPLAVTKAYVENWEYIDEKDRPEYAAKLTEEVDNMSKMINDLLNLSKMEEGDRKPKLEEVDLYALGKALLEQLRPLISERQLKAEFLPEENNGKYIVNADLEMMRTAIGNFITNAVKYSKTQVRVRLSDDGRTVTFRVSNDADQIPKKDVKRIWDVFYKGDKSRTDRFKSSGLGLAFCKTIFEAHKARYGCTSGTSMTSFWFTLSKAKEKKK
ncbi:MAG: HAMP domain-containing histidine kinase [Clostridiales bacterium]|nr:HAMP domain-containing histidine kinase [Clostridiales bacterium]